jgi:5-methylthioadenosine/S-adenosylhomocysteine deaminase
VFSAADGLIRAVGEYATMSEQFPTATVIGNTSDIVTPGFVNTHDHLSENLISGMGETMSLYEWVDRLIKPVLLQMTREMARAGTMLPRSPRGTARLGCYFSRTASG